MTSGLADSMLVDFLLLLCPAFGMCAVVGGFLVRGLWLINQDRLLKDEADSLRLGGRMRPLPVPIAGERRADAVSRRMKSSLDCLPLRLCVRAPVRKMSPV